MDELDPDKQELIPSDGVLLQTEVVLEEGDTAYDVLERAAREANMHLESSVTPGYRSVYIEGIANLYEFDCGSLSGWIYFVNGESFSTARRSKRCRRGTRWPFDTPAIWEKTSNKKSPVKGVCAGKKSFSKGFFAMREKIPFPGNGRQGSFFKPPAAPKRI